MQSLPSLNQNYIINDLRYSVLYQYNQLHEKKEENMKKITTLLLCLISVPAFADDWYGDYNYGYSSGVQRDTYVGVRLHQNKHIAFGYEVLDGGNTTLKDDGIGIGLTFGNRLTNHVKVEFETLYTKGKERKYDTDFNFDVWANMLNVYIYQQFDGAVEPYAGIGIGIAGLWGSVNGAGLNMSDSTADMAWAAMLGVNFALNERIDLNVGVKYQNYGDIEHKNGDNTYASTEIDATEIYIGASYKFSLK